MFKGQRSNVVSTAPGEGGLSAKTFDAAMRVSRGEERGVWNNVRMAPARERIESQKGVS